MSIFGVEFQVKLDKINCKNIFRRCARWCVREALGCVNCCRCGSGDGGGGDGDIANDMENKIKTFWSGEYEQSGQFPIILIEHFQWVNQSYFGDDRHDLNARFSSSISMCGGAGGGGADRFRTIFLSLRRCDIEYTFVSNWERIAAASEERVVAQNKKYVYTFSTRFFTRCKCQKFTSRSNTLIQIHTVLIAFSNHFYNLLIARALTSCVPATPIHLWILFYFFLISIFRNAVRWCDRSERITCSGSWMKNGKKYRSFEVKNIQIYKSARCEMCECKKSRLSSSPLNEGTNERTEERLSNELMYTYFIFISRIPSIASK